MRCGKLNELTARMLRVYIDVKISMQHSSMCSAGIKNIFLSSYFVGVYFYKRRYVLWGLYTVENPLAKLLEKVRFIRC